MTLRCHTIIIYVFTIMADAGKVLILRAFPISLTGPSSPDSHLLRVQSAFIGRRLSDNALIMPRIHVNHSSCSSPGDGSLGSFPIRRHSSFGAERRGSACMNLSPPTVGLYTIPLFSVCKCKIYILLPLYSKKSTICL